MKRAVPFAVIAVLSFAASARAEDRHGLAKTDPLYVQVMALDAAVFDAFNRCDLEKLGSYFADDLEFFHDNDGLSGKKAFLEAVKNNICGKMQRALVTDSVEVYPMKTYGALQTGTHRFLHPGREAIDGVGEGKFIHLWQKKDGVWKITRAMSFDHHSVEDGTPKPKPTWPSV
ncbi:MAG: nuclear transport factor 2 family protein [Vicinamibacteria bacterium]